MSSQESVGESQVSHPTLGPGANSDAYHFGPSTEDEMEADLKSAVADEEKGIAGYGDLKASKEQEMEIATEAIEAKTTP